MPSRTLIVMRHAKAEQAGSTDHERALAERGIADATAAGRWLRGEGVEVEAALVSSADRTLATFSAVADGAGWDLDPSVERSLYSGGPDTALDVVREVADDVASVLIVGHNPTMGYLVQLLDDGEGDPDAVAELAAGGYPTGALTVFTVQGPWASLEPGSATVRAYHVPRG